MTNLYDNLYKPCLNMLICEISFKIGSFFSRKNKISKN